MLYRDIRCRFLLRYYVEMGGYALFSLLVDNFVIDDFDDPVCIVDDGRGCPAFDSLYNQLYYS